jgi:hypothetical protein
MLGNRHAAAEQDETEDKTGPHHRRRFLAVSVRCFPLTSDNIVQEKVPQILSPVVEALKAPQSPASESTGHLATAVSGGVPRA